MQLKRWIDHAIQFQSIPAPTFQEAERATLLAQRLEQIGLSTVELDPHHNVLVCIPGGNAQPLVISAHLDTVFPLSTDLRISRTGKTLHGPGIGDNAIALAALLELAQDFLDQPPPGDIWLAGNIGEEGLGNLVGMQTVVQRFGSSPAAYLVLEGMSLGFVYHRGLPIRRYRMVVETPGGHSWIHAGRPSATHILLQAGQRLTQLPRPDKPRTSFNIGRIEGGFSVNTIAAQAEMEIEVRSEEETVVESYEQALHEIVDEFRSDEIELNLTTIGTRPGGGIPGDHPLVLAAVQALEAVGEPLIALEIGSTDASWPLSRGYPAVCVGLTRGGGAHSLDEYIELEPLERGYQALRHLIKSIMEPDRKQE